MSITFDIHKYLKDHIKECILIEHVYPFLHNHQSSKLLTDIKSFHKTINILEEKYSTDYQPITLFNDIMYFMNNRVVSVDGETTNPNYMNILHRFHKGKMYNDETIYGAFLNLNYSCRVEKNISRINRIFMGMLSPEERESFIKNYV